MLSEDCGSFEAGAQILQFIGMSRQGLENVLRSVFECRSGDCFQNLHSSLVRNVTPEMWGAHEDKTSDGIVEFILLFYFAGLKA